MKKATAKKILSILLTLCMLLTLLPAAALAADPPTDYIIFAQSSFSDTAGLECSGNASLDSGNSRIQLVPYSSSQVGGVFTDNKVAMGSSGFSMAAQVYCGSTAAQADGFALVLAQDTKACVSEATGGSLGYAFRSSLRYHYQHSYR